jgi:glycine/D-amino acid oxidase-like deaminating enzyme
MATPSINDDVPASYWQLDAGPTGVRFAELPATAEIAVLGGGLLGVCTAYWLARSGARPVLLEREWPGYGATGRNGGFLTAGTAEGYPNAITRLGHAAAHAIWRLTLENRALMRLVLAEEAIDCDYREPGHVSLALGDEQLAEVQRTAAALAADGFGGDVLDRAQVQELVSTPLGPLISGALYSAGSGLLHSARFIDGLAQAAVQHGTRIVRAEVAEIVQNGAGARVTTNAGMLDARALVVAANAWTGRVLPQLAGVVTPVRGQVLSHAPLPRVFEVGLGAGHTATGEYWQQTPGGAIVLGGCRAVAPNRDVGEWRMAPTAIVQEAIEGVLPALFPQLSGLRVEQRWAGLMGFTPDYLPIADRAPQTPAAWVTGGFCGHGMPFGMRLGQLLAEAALHDRAPAALAPLRLNRPSLQPQ